jgi:hypothetical protein
MIPPHVELVAPAGRLECRFFLVMTVSAFLSSSVRGPTCDVDDFGCRLRYQWSGSTEGYGDHHGPWDANHAQQKPIRAAPVKLLTYAQDMFLGGKEKRF